MRVIDLKTLMKGHRLRSYSKLRKAELIESLQNNPQQLQNWEPTRPQHTPTVQEQPSDSRTPHQRYKQSSGHTKPPHPKRSLPPPPPLVRFRPDRSRQLEERNPQI